MHGKKEHTDILRNMFSRLPEKELSANFRDELLKKVMQEAVRMKKQEERKGLFITIALAVFFFVSGVIALVYLDLPKTGLQMPDLSSVPFFTYIGGLVFILLAVDYKVRKRFHEKHSEQER